MIQHTITVSKTARYYTAGNLDGNTETIWLVCHGYGQLAEYFIKHFSLLENGKTFIVAPEGLSKFYLDGVTGRMGAAWMTKEDRENEVADYLNFLNKLFDKLFTSVDFNKVKLNVLGFSQGTATVCRWLAQSNVKVNRLILWAGTFPVDVELSIHGKRFREIPVTVVYGDKDEYLEYLKPEDYKKMLGAAGFNYNIVTFEGKHEMNAEVLKEVAESSQLALGKEQ
ncbi:MAG: alpha/beta hydrolase [Bacteroidia bacterium]